MHELLITHRSSAATTLVTAITAALFLAGIYLLLSTRFKNPTSKLLPLPAVRFAIGLFLTILGAYGVYKLTYSSPFDRVAFDDKSVTLFPQSWRSPTTLPWNEITSIEVQKNYVKPHMQNFIVIDTKSAGHYTSVGLQEAQSPNPIKEVAQALQRQLKTAKP